ncbi:MAG: helix-turn-helix transcriptional regulator [Prolixibacteraceae bacterium]
MKDRIVKFLESEKISPAEFADKIGVQRSSMSHILNGRNFPSAAFIQKMLQAYPLVNPRWLMIGEGTMNIGSPASKEDSDRPILPPIGHANAEDNQDQGILSENEKPNDIGSLFATRHHVGILDVENIVPDVLSPANTDNKTLSQSELPDAENSGEIAKAKKSTINTSTFPAENLDDKEIEKVIFFYKDKTFSVYRPS